MPHSSLSVFFFATTILKTWLFSFAIVRTKRKKSSAFQLLTSVHPVKSNIRKYFKMNLLCPRVCNNSNKLCIYGVYKAVATISPSPCHPVITVLLRRNNPLFLPTVFLALPKALKQRDRERVLFFPMNNSEEKEKKKGKTKLKVLLEIRHSSIVISFNFSQIRHYFWNRLFFASVLI